MLKKIIMFFILNTVVFSAFAALQNTTDRFINKSLYKNVYPSTLNNVASQTNTETQIPVVNQQNKPTNTNTNMGRRRIVKRTTNARTASTPTNTRRVVPRSTTARSGIRSNQNVNRNNSNKNINTRGVTNKSAARNNATARSSTSYTYTGTVSTQRCFSDYRECMEAYCERPDTAYNRCYCSAKLAQIDSKYQNKIDDLIQQIVKLRYESDVDSDEIKEYWDKTVAGYTGDNPWVNIDNALNINWADTESRVRGQQAFNTGHSYCARILKGCSAMATNMRDAYKSEIARDCEAYEKSLQRIQAAAESVMETYND